ncbi:MAG: hypothetical protein J2P21_18375 [Chloracidobacterium sp.]|nr:hypothetical protein [Chloracidobacterium sp.]
MNNGVDIRDLNGRKRPHHSFHSSALLSYGGWRGFASAISIWTGAAISGLRKIPARSADAARGIAPRPGGMDQVSEQRTGRTLQLQPGDEDQDENGGARGER